MAKRYVQVNSSELIDLATSLIKELSQVKHLSIGPHLHSACLQIMQDLHHFHTEVRSFSLFKFEVNCVIYIFLC